MNVLIIGSGGREHSLYMKIKSDPIVDNVYMLGNNGAIDANLLIDIDGFDFNALYKEIIAKEIELTIVGPEVYLEAGIIDYLRAHGCLAIGPDKHCAKLESSKNFAKQMMASANIPTAKYQYVTTVEAGLATAATYGYPIVLKYDGLAAGKGVAICTTEDEAADYLKAVLEDKCFGSSGIVVEECLVGEEYSVFAVVNGTSYSILPVAQDYKRAYDGDLGPNTGGMGANTTSKYDEQIPYIKQHILEPLLAQFIADGYKYTGFLYIGLMQTTEGPKVIEFNVRMGDPETQIVMQKLDSSLLEIIDHVYNNRCFTPTIKSEQYVGVVVASNGYPNAYEKNVILELSESMCPVFQMGTIMRDNVLRSTGGRVLMVTAEGSTVEAARSSVYKKLSAFENDKLFYRNDIGLGRI